MKEDVQEFFDICIKGALLEPSFFFEGGGRGLGGREGLSICLHCHSLKYLTIQEK